MSAKTFTINKNVDVTKDEYIKHLEERAEYWRKRTFETQDQQERDLAKYKNKQQKRLLEIQMIELRIKNELKELK